MRRHSASCKNLLALSLDSSSGRNTYLYLYPLVTPMMRLFCRPLASAPTWSNIHGRVLLATYDESADGTEGSDALPRSVVELDLDEVLLGLRKS